MGERWGYHELMHVFVTLGFFATLAGIRNVALTCPEGQWGDDGALAT